MSEHSISIDKPTTNETITLIRDELNSIHSETHKTRKFLASSLAKFTEHSNIIDARLDRIERLLLSTLPDYEEREEINDENPAVKESVSGQPNETSDATESKARPRPTDEEEETKDEKPAVEKAVSGQSNDTSRKTDNKSRGKYKLGAYDKQDINEETSKTIANSKPERVKRENKPPERWVPEIKKEPTATKKPAASSSAKAPSTRKPSEVRSTFPNLKPKKGKGDEIKDEQGSDVEIPREVDSKLPNKKSNGKKGKSNVERAPTTADDQRNDREPSKKKRKASETDEEQGPELEEREAKKAKKAKKP